MTAFALQYFDGNFSTPVETTKRPIIGRPFKDAIPADLYPRTFERRYLVDPRAFSPRLAIRTSYTNQLTYSEDFSNAAWTKSELTRTAAALANPWDGQATFSKFLETVTAAEHVLSQAYTFTAVPHVVFALVAGGLTRTFVRLKANDGTTSFTAFFDLANGLVFGTPANCTATIKRYVDQAGLVSYKCAIFFTPAAAAGNVYVQPSTNGSTVSYAGTVTNGIYVGGFQVERASAAGPYIVTTSAARTVSSPDVDGIYNSSAVDSNDFAFHTDETDVDTDGTSPAPLSRTYATIPASQSKPISKFVDRPVMSGVKSGSAYAVSVDGGVTSHVWTTRTAVTGSTGSGSANINWVAHGHAVGDIFALWSGDTFVGCGSITSVTADTFGGYITGGATITPFATVTYAAFTSTAAVRYVNGPIEADCQEVTTFWLLGFTANGATTVSTSADIPLTAVQMDPISWLGVLEAYRASPSNATLAIESTQGKEPYRGQILGYKVTKVQVADVYDTVAV